MTQTVTQENFDNFIQHFGTSQLNSSYALTYRFIPCIEYSKDFNPLDLYNDQYNNKYYSQGEWNGKNYYAPCRTYPQYATPDPIKNIVDTLLITPNKVEQGQCSKQFVYKEMPNDIFLEFDFKHLYESDQRKNMFGSRSESEARCFHRETIQRNVFLVSEMSKASSRKIGDISRAYDAYCEYENNHNCFSYILRNVYDFTYALGIYNQPHYGENINSNSRIDSLKITDFYTIVPDNPSPQDLIKAYAPHKEYIKTISSKYNSCHDVDKVFNKHVKDAVSMESTVNNVNVFFLAVFTKKEFDEAIFEVFKRYYSQASNHDTFKAQCTVENVIKGYKRMMKESLKDKSQEEQTRLKNNYEHHWINSLLNYKDGHIIMTISNRSASKYWSRGNIVVQVA